jgi:hypothetical protein
MTLAGIDSELGDWQDRQRLIDENLNSFAELLIFRRLCGIGGRTPEAFDGQTQQRVAAAMETFRDLREQQAVLAATLQRARELRASVSRLMPARHTLEEIEQILTGPSIQLESSSTPAARRELLRDVAQAVRVSPGRFLEIMLDSFRFVRDTLVGLESAAEQNTRTLDSQRNELARLRDLANSLDGHLSSASALDGATQLISELTVLAGRDPLAVSERIPGLVARIQGQADALDSASRLGREIDDKLRESTALIEQVRQMHDRAKRAFAERQLKIQLPRDASVPLPSGDGEVEALVVWLSKLQLTVQKREHGPAGIGLKKWANSAAGLLAHDQRAAEADESVIRARRELRGLFDALQAKACNSGRAEEARLVALGGEISQMFSQRPTPLDQVRELVTQYQEGLV